ncbi:uncharacterized protein [Primulina huaijiensis]|uniref:uncharacterized protein n=1 Tax=Primulina huaijiensis TaxID=1492673 RepID=UPI003CC74969
MGTLPETSVIPTSITKITTPQSTLNLPVIPPIMGSYNSSGDTEPPNSLIIGGGWEEHVMEITEERKRRRGPIWKLTSFRKSLKAIIPLDLQTTKPSFCYRQDLVTKPAKIIHISPYLFIICTEGLSALIRNAERLGHIHGIKVCRGAPSIIHLFFADDSMLFFQANATEGKYVKNIIERYEKASGQAINLSKSGIMYNGNVPNNEKAAISDLLGISTGLDTSRYLGLPSLIGRKKKQIFAYLKDRVWARLQGWRTKPLSRAGCEILIKSVPQAIPTFCMSTSPPSPPPSVAEEIQRMINSFWWGRKNNATKGLCVPKEFGVMGFRDFYGFNLAILGKQEWKLLSDPNATICRIYKAKYYPRGDFLNANIGHNPSFAWRSILASQVVLKRGYRWRIGDGSHINILKDPWLRDSSNFYVEKAMIPELHDWTVQDLMVRAHENGITKSLNLSLRSRILKKSWKSH